MYEFDSAGLVIAWLLSNQSSEDSGTFFLAERDAGKLVTVLAGFNVGGSTDEVIRARGRRVLKKLVRLRVIRIVEAGEAWTGKDRSGKATTFEWIGKRS